MYILFISYSIYLYCKFNIIYAKISALCGYVEGERYPRSASTYQSSIKRSSVRNTETADRAATVSKDLPR